MFKYEYEETTYYINVDHIVLICVREPISYDYAKKIGIQNVKLIPDAVYGLPKMDKFKIKEIASRYQVPDKYITVTGSSILKRDKKSFRFNRSSRSVRLKEIICLRPSFVTM